MAKFKYRFQTLLNVKENMEKNVKNELGIAVQELEKQKEILRKLQYEIESQENEYRYEGERKTVILKLRQRLEYIKLIQERKEQQQQRVKEAKRNVDKIRERLIEAMKEKKVLENLKEKEWIVFKKEQEKLEQLLVDELVNYKESKKTDED